MYARFYRHKTLTSIICRGFIDLKENLVNLSDGTVNTPVTVSQTWRPITEATYNVILGKNKLEKMMRLQKEIDG